MSLQIFFDPITLTEGLEDAFSVRNNIVVYGKQFPELANIDMVILGVPEDRGSQTNIGCSEGPDQIRRQLYVLKRGSTEYKIADLGNLRPGETWEDTTTRLKEVCGELLRRKIFPIILGGSHDLDYAQFRAYEGMDLMIDVLCVDARLDLSVLASEASRRHTRDILMHEPNYLFNYSHLAYQSYLTDKEAVQALEKMHFESYRLGVVRENMQEMEPVIRSADMISFDLGAIRLAEAPGNAQAFPFGLTGEEACRICWYAGLSSKLSSFGLYEYNPSLDQRMQTASVIATMLWYLMEGFYQRTAEMAVDSSEYIKYLVHADSSEEKLVFYKNKVNEKWWMEVPYPGRKNKYVRNSIVPCSYNDYLMATRGELPLRWVLTHHKLI